MPDPADAPDTAPLVTVIYDPGALGDLAYNDLIYEGVERAAVRHGIRTRQYSPENREEGISFLESLFDQLSTPAADTTRHLLIVAGSSYDSFVRANNRRLEANPRADLLYFETKEPLEGKGSSVHIRFYGAMYEAGAITPLFSMESLLVAANPYDVADAVAGFQAGFASDMATELAGSSAAELKLFVEYISEERGSGFTISDQEALDIMLRQPWSHWYYGTVIPLCGGASAVFRRMAEDVGYFTFVGIDKVILSASSDYAAVKHADRAVERCIGEWMSEEGLPKHQSLGLAEGFTEMVFCPAEPANFTPIIEYLTEERLAQIRREAMEKEAEYEHL